MRSFVSNLWQVVHPYRLRFYGGCVLGVMAGLKDPLLAASVWLVFAVVFPQVDGKGLEQVEAGHLMRQVRRIERAAVDDRHPLQAHGR